MTIVNKYCFRMLVHIQVPHCRIRSYWQLQIHFINVIYYTNTYQTLCYRIKLFLFNLNHKMKTLHGSSSSNCINTVNKQQGAFNNRLPFFYHLDQIWEERVKVNTDKKYNNLKIFIANCPTKTLFPQIFCFFQISLLTMNPI